MFQVTVLEVPHINETETNQTIGIKNIQITDHETIQIIDQTIIIITKDQVTIPRTEFLIIQIDKENILSHRIEILHNINIHNKTIEVAHLNIKETSTRYNQLKKPNQTLSVLIPQKS